MVNDAGGNGPEKTPREKWHYTSIPDALSAYGGGNIKYEPVATEKLADSANEKDVDTIGFKGCMDTIDGGADALLDSKNFDVGNISIMIDNKNIVETCIMDLNADIENDIKKLKDELNDAYNAVVTYHNEKQDDYNTAAGTEATKNNTSGKPWFETIPE